MSIGVICGLYLSELSFTQNVDESVETRTGSHVYRTGPPDVRTVRYFDGRCHVSHKDLDNFLTTIY